MFTVDSDLHIHSYISACAKDPAQTTGRILQYAREMGLKTVCLTDHFWDETVPGASDWYKPQNYAHVSAAKPLPRDENIRFLFGCETELDRNLTLGISRQRLSSFDFVVIPTTHFHMKPNLHEEDRVNVQSRANAWVRRLDGVLNMELPFHKIGIAHLTCRRIAPTREEYLAVLQAIPEKDIYRLFRKAAQLGVGIELNADDIGFAPEETDIVLRPYRIAKECGCKFYCGSDAHDPQGLCRAMERFRRMVGLLELSDEDKFVI